MTIVPRAGTGLKGVYQLYFFVTPQAIFKLLVKLLLRLRFALFDRDNG